MTKKGGKTVPKKGKKAGVKVNRVLPIIVIPKNHKLIVDTGYRVRDTKSGKSWNVKYYTFKCTAVQQKVIDSVLHTISKQNKPINKQPKNKPSNKLMSRTKMLDRFKTMDLTTQKEFLQECIRSIKY